MTDRELQILHLENRITKLSVHEVRNKNIINKTKRKLRKIV